MHSIPVELIKAGSGTNALLIYFTFSFCVFLLIYPESPFLPVLTEIRMNAH